MSEQQRRRLTPKRNFRIRTKQYQMERWLQAGNGEQLKSDGLASLKVWSAIETWTYKKHCCYETCNDVCKSDSRYSDGKTWTDFSP